MENTVLIAIISAVASLFVAVTSLIAILINSRNTSRTVESVERLKNDFARATRFSEILDEDLKAALQALKISVEAIQKLKNEIQRFRKDKDAALATGVIEGIQKASRNIIENYETSLAILSQFERDTFHQAKEYASDCETLAQNILSIPRQKKSKIPPAVAPEVYNEFDKLHTDLSDTQRILVDSRYERMLGLSQNSMIKNP